MTLTYWQALGLTLLLEVPLAVVLAPSGLRRRVVGDALLLNLLTHPLATLMVHRLGAPLLPVEVGVTVVEALGYRWVTRMPWSRALLVSVVCNGVTTGVGLWL